MIGRHLLRPARRRFSGSLRGDPLGQPLRGRSRLAGVVAALLSAGVGLAPIDVVAQTPEPPPGDAAQAAPAPAATDEEAIQRFKDGRKLLEEGKFDEALVELRASFDKMPSPNTELLIGHALRLSNRRAEAAATYRRVIVTAGEKVRAGEDRFQATLEEAGRLGASLRAQLVELDIVVTGAPEGTTVAVGSDTAPVESNARGLTAKVLHEPGEITVVATAPDGRTVTQQVTGAAGGQSAILLEIPAAEVAGPPPKKTEVKADAADIWPPPVPSWIAAGVGAGGLVVFGIFGAMSSSSASDLEACSPRCPESLRDTADSGSTNQTIANVGLVIGAVGLVTAGVLWVVWPDDEEKKAGDLSPRLVLPGRAAAAPPRAAVRVSPAGRADLLLSF